MNDIGITAMALDISIDRERHILFVRHYGPAGVDEYCTIPAKTAPLLTQHKLSKILVDISKSGFRLHTIDLYDFVLELREWYPIGSKIATIYSPEGLEPENLRFLENLAFNRAVRLKTFADTAGALTWLN